MKKIIAYIIFSINSATAFSLEIPTCPEQILVENKVIQDVDGWVADYTSYLISSKHLRKDGVYKTQSMAPIIGLYSKDRSVAPLGEDNIDEMMEEKSIYPDRFWTYDSEMVSSGYKYIVICESEFSQYYLYKFINQPFVKCTHVKSKRNPRVWSEERLFCE